MLHKLALAQVVPGSLSEDDESVSALAEKLSAEDVQLFYQIALLGQKDLPLAPDPRSGFEMVMLRMLAFRPIGGDESDRPSGQIARPAPQQVPQPRGEKLANEREQAPQQIEPAATAPAKQATTGGGDWFAIVKSLKVMGLTRELANNCTLKELDDKQCLLQLERNKASIKSDKTESQLERALQVEFGETLKLKIEIAEASETETPAEVIKRHNDEKQQQAEESIQNDENVRVLKELFDAKEILGSIKPL
ncbi:MAG: hypothetical protein DRQ61_11620 [Gammaproteobacteria bacterium]|nr:MAG: hypothetical protein DRQ61_11620 [Gammaproteobacteria bacterium]